MASQQAERKGKPGHEEHEGEHAAKSHLARRTDS
jgi:hypothetical protein